MYLMLILSILPLKAMDAFSWRPSATDAPPGCSIKMGLALPFASCDGYQPDPGDGSNGLRQDTEKAGY